MVLSVQASRAIVSCLVAATLSALGCGLTSTPMGEPATKFSGVADRSRRAYPSGRPSWRALWPSILAAIWTQGSLEAWVSRCRLENHGRNQMGPPRGDATHSDGNLPYPRLIGWLSFRFLGLASSSASKEPVTQLGREQLSEGAGPIATYTQI